MELFNDISENKFVMILLNEKQYNQRLAEIIKGAEKNHTKVCYVCLSKPYTDIMKYLKTNGFDVDKFFFVDVLSSHYKKPEQAENCIFIDAPDKLVAVHVAVTKAITEKNCSTVIFDTISSLLVYEQSYDIVKFTHQLTVEEKHQSTNKVFIVLKEKGTLEKYTGELIKDIGMFADKSIEVAD